MNSGFKKLLSIFALGLMVAGFGAGVRQSLDAPRAGVSSVRVAEGDIGDGTSPTRKS